MRIPQRSVIDPRYGSNGLAYMLGIREAQSYPEEIDLSSITPVVDLSMGGYLRVNDSTRYQHAELVAFALGGLQTVTARILSPGNAVTATPQIIVPIGCNFAVWSVYEHIEFDAAGAAAFNGVHVASIIRMINTSGLETKKWCADWTMVNTVRILLDGMMGTEKITREHVYVVPAGCALEMTTWTQAGANFPANTTLTYRIMGQNIPVGAAIPPWI